MRPRPAILAAALAIPVLSLSVARAGPDAGIGDAAERRDLESCLETALSVAPSLEADREAENAARAAADAAAAARWPVLDFAAGHQYQSKYMHRRLDLGALGGIDLAFGDGHQTDLSLGLSVPLYTGGRITRTAAAAAAGARSSADLREAERLAVKRDVRLAFYTALGREARLEATRLAVARLDRHREEVAAAAGLGAATEEDLLRVEASRREAEIRRLAAAASCDSAGFVLGRLLGRPGTLVRPDGDLSLSLLEGRDLSPERLARRPEVAALEAERERRQLLGAAVRGTFLPAVRGEVRGHRGRPGVDVLTDEWMTYATAAVTLNWTLWDAGARSRRADENEARAREAAARGRDVREAFATRLAAGDRQLEAARSELDAARERVDLERRILDHVDRRRRAAAATESEYLDAEDDLAEAEAAAALAQTGVRLAEAALLWILAY